MRLKTMDDPVERIFQTAAEMKSGQERDAYLDDACAGDEVLRKELCDLLQHDRQADNFLEGPAVEAVPPIEAAAICESPGTMIGPYKLLEQIGEGAFGLVFVAEQLKPVRRKVALKIIKPGMDTKEVIARFEVERQALALMAHPNICQVFDAGATQSGRPYFVMELVRGVPTASR